jgi:hypothetical protein
LNPFGDDDSWLQAQLAAAEPLQATCRTLGTDLLAAATAFKSHGTELPGELLARYVQWEEDAANLRAQWDAEPRLENYAPDSEKRQSLGAWVKGIEACIEEIREYREAVAAEREQKLSVIDSILGLSCHGGQQNGLKDAQILAESLRLQLLDDSKHWEEALRSPDHESLATLWTLVTDAREGRGDDPESLKRSEEVAKHFGVHVAMQAYAGKFVSNGR